MREMKYYENTFECNGKYTDHISNLGGFEIFKTCINKHKTFVIKVRTETKIEDMSRY